MAKGRKRPASDMDDRSTSDQQQGTPNTGGGDAEATAAAAAAAALGGTSSTSADEVRFGKHLASSDKKVRDRTVLALREWLQRRSKGGALSDLDLLKIWRGLWYCMFMCDKAPIQRELAQNLAGLVNLFKDDRGEGVRFFRSFCVTMQRDWERIDNLRIDKYYTLVRLCLREAIAFCRLPGKKTPDTSPKPPSNKKQKKRRKANVSSSSLEEMEVGPSAEPAAATWDVGLLRAMSGVMEEEVVTLYPAAIGLRLHLADVWTEEAFVAGGEDMPTEAFLVAVAPWLRASVAPETNPVVFKRTFEGVLEGLLGYFPKLNEGMEEEDDDDEGDKKVFKLVELSKVQACLFEAAAAPQTRPKRRTQLYQLHRRYQQRTGVAPNASAPPSGLIPPPPVESEESDSDDSEGGEYVEAGQRPRAVRGPEPAVVGWVAAGVEAGVIRGDDGEVAPKKRKEDGEVKAKRSPKKIKEDGDALEEEGEEAGTPAAAVVDGSSSVKKNKKKRKSEYLLNGKDGFADDDDADAGEVTVVGVAEESSSVERKRKKKRKGRKDDDGDDDDVSGGTGVSMGSGVCSGGGGGESSADDGTPAKKKAKKKAVSPGGDAGTSSADDATSAKKKRKKDRSEAEDTAVEKLSTPPSSGKKKNNKEKRTKSSPGVVVAAGTDTMSPVPVNKKNAFSEMPPPPTPTAVGVASFKTPPKGARSPRKVPGSEGSARKTVTFGHDMFKDHAKSMKDVKTCEVTPAKDSGTPRKGLLKVGGGGGSGKKASGGKGSTPRRSKRAADFF